MGDGPLGEAPLADLMEEGPAATIVDGDQAYEPMRTYSRWDSTVFTSDNDRVTPAAALVSDDDGLIYITRTIW